MPVSLPAPVLWRRPARLRARLGRRAPRLPRFAALLGRTAAGGVPLLLLACGGTDPSPPKPALVDTYWGLALNHHAVLLSTTAPWDTLPLVATPVNYRGDTLTGLGTPQFSSSDIQHVTVTPDGVLHAIDVLAPGVEVKVTAWLTVNNVTHSDTVYVRVSATDNPPPVLDSVSIHPLPGDSAKLPAGSNYLFFKTTPLTARSFDAQGDSIPNLPVAIRSSDSSIAFFNRSLGAVGGRQPGVVTLYASTTAFGVTKADTLSYRIGWPVVSTVEVRYIAPLGAGGDSIPVFLPSEVTIGTGGYITWGASLHVANDVHLTFADAQLPQVVDPSTLPSVFIFFPQVCDYFAWDCSPGNITFGPEHKSSATRGFTAPGAYEYHSTALGISGRVIVVDER